MNILNTPKALKEKIANKAHVIGVIGLGYVGLPLVNAICNKGIKAIGFDVDPTKIQSINAGKSYIGGVSDENLKAHTQNALFHSTCNFDELCNVDAIIICVPTPLDENENPDLSYIVNTTQVIAENLQDGQLIILESTTYPGTVAEIMVPILNEAATSKNIVYFIAYSPEREDPGNENFATSSTPKIVGADTPEVLELTIALYEQFIEKIVPVSSIKIAEAAKITENVFRAVNIALANELKLIYDKMGIDVWDVIDAAKTKPFGYMPFYPGPGIGGHCIPIDPIYLAWKAKECGQQTQFIELAATINQSMSEHIINKLISSLGLKTFDDLKNKHVLILGVAYKKNVSDQRESPAFPIMSQLLNIGVKLEYHDPHIPNILSNRAHPHLAQMPSTKLSKESLSNVDAVILITDHADVDYDLVSENASVIIDTRNVFAKADNVIKA